MTDSENMLYLCPRAIDHALRGPRSAPSRKKILIRLAVILHWS